MSEIILPDSVIERMAREKELADWKSKSHHEKLTEICPLPWSIGAEHEGMCSIVDANGNAVGTVSMDFRVLPPVEGYYHVCPQHTFAQVLMSLKEGEYTMKT